MLGSFDNRLNIFINPSFALTATLLALHAGALAAVLSTDLPLALRVSLAAAAAVSLYYALALHALRRSLHAVGVLELEEGDQFTLQLRNEDYLGPCRLGAYYVNRWLVILQLRCGQRRLPLNLVIPADAVDTRAFRRFCARLRARRPGA